MTHKIFQQLISQIINAYECKKPNIQINYCANTLQLVNFLKEEGLIRGATIITKPKKLKILVYLKYNSNLEPAIAQSRNISRTNHSTFLTLSNANALFRNFNLVVFSNKNSKITKKSFRKNNSVVFLLK